MKALYGMPLAVLLSPATLTQCLQLRGKGIKGRVPLSLWDPRPRDPGQAYRVGLAGSGMRFQELPGLGLLVLWALQPGYGWHLEQDVASLELGCPSNAPRRPLSQGVH